MLNKDLLRPSRFPEIRLCANTWTFVLGNALILVIGKNFHNFSKEIDLIVKEKYVDFPQDLSVLKKT